MLKDERGSAGTGVRKVSSAAAGGGLGKRLAIAAVCLSALAASRPSAAPAAGAASPTYSFSIAPGALGRAIEDFSVVTGVTVLYEQPPDTRLTSPGVSGVMTQTAALSALLSGTGLQPRFTDERDVVLVPTSKAREEAAAADAAPPPDGAPVMALDTLRAEAPPVRVEAWIYDAYARVVQASVQSAIRKSLKIRYGSYRVLMEIWVDPAGKILRAQLVASTDRRGLDAALSAIVGGATVDQPPPRGLLQPITIEVSAREGF